MSTTSTSGVICLTACMEQGTNGNLTKLNRSGTKMNKLPATSFRFLLFCHLLLLQFPPQLQPHIVSYRALYAVGAAADGCPVDIGSMGKA